MDKVSRYVNSIEISGIRKFYNKVKEYDNAISLTVGEPDFHTPEAIKKGIERALREGKTKYTLNQGIEELREDIKEYLKGFNIDYDAEEICITVGGSGALSIAFTTILNPGDTVLIPEISYPAYENCVKLLGGKCITYKLKEDFTIDFKNLKKQIIDEKPKAMVICFPSNPTGVYLSKNSCRELYKIIKENSILVLTDEIYQNILYKDEYYSVAQYKDIQDKIIYISGFSKSFAITGLRLGFVCTKKEMVKALVKVNQYTVSAAPSIIQYGTHYGFWEGLLQTKAMMEEFKKRRDYVYKRLVDMNLKVIIPEGAFYFFPSIKKFNIKSEEFATRLLEENGVALVPGNVFGKAGDDYIRISYARDMKTLKEGMDRLGEFIRKLEN